MSGQTQERLAEIRMSRTDIADAKANAEKALRIPDLEWARDLVHGLATDVLRLVQVHADYDEWATINSAGYTEAAAQVDSLTLERDRLREALGRIASVYWTDSSLDGPQHIARRALAAGTEPT